MTVSRGTGHQREPGPTTNVIPQDRLRRLRRALFGSLAEDSLEVLMNLADLRPDQATQALISVSGPLPMEMLTSASVIPGLAPTEALFLGGSPTALPLSSGGQMVLGPVCPITRAPDGIVLARRTARQVAATQVRCTELLADLIVLGDPLMADLLISKHLAALEALPPIRRAKFAEFALQWVERNLSVNEFAREIGMPPQTAHSRFKSLRKVLDNLDDPAQRLELIVALRAALARWRNEG